MAMRFSVVASALSSDVREAAAAARRLGFAGLLLDARSPLLDVADLSASARREILSILASQSQEIAALRFDLGPKGLAPNADVDQILARLERAFEAASPLRAKCVCIDLGALPAVPRAARAKPQITPEQAGLILVPPVATATAVESSASSSQPADPAAVALVNSALVEIGRLCDHTGVTVAFRSSLASFDSLHQVLLSASCPWFGVDLDPVEMLLDAWDMDETFSRFGPLLRHLRARDAVVGAEHRSRPAPIGQGNVDWRYLFSSLREADYRGFITIDPNDLPNRPAAASAGKTFLEQMQLN